MRDPQRRELLFWWVLAWLALMLCAVIRGYMDDVGLPTHGAETEHALFGSLPTVSLQDNVYPLSPGVFSWAARVVYASWFVVPWLIALHVSWKRPQRLGSFFLWWIALHFTVNPLFALFPLQPPWMANPEVIRVVALHAGSGVPDNNPLAAMPSLHVALPLLISFWLLRERLKMLALAMLVYAILVAFVVVLSGEHYVIDVAGGVAVAGAIALAAQFSHRRAFSSFFARLERAVKRRGDDGPPLVADAGISNRDTPGLTGRTGAIFAITAALVVLVSVQAALSHI